MRRVAITRALPGMVLGVPIYGRFGNILLAKGSNLAANSIAVLSRMGIAEVFIDDDFTDDLSVWPLFSPELEAAMVMELRHLLGLTQKMLTAGNFIQLDLNQLFQLTYEMTCQLLPAKLGDIYIGGDIRLEDYEVVHPVKVCCLAMLVGNTYGLQRQELANLGVAALVENIGQLLTPRWLLDKTERPSAEELEMLREHSQNSAAILQGFGLTPPHVTNSVLQHHERWNGGGYPSGISGSDIDLTARIIALADTCCALVSRRSYRTAMRSHEAAEFIASNRGKLFDPDLVSRFIEGVPVYPPGVLLRLNTGEIAIVTDARPGVLGRPKLRLYSSKLSQSMRPYEIDLTEAQYEDKYVVEIMEH